MYCYRSRLCVCVFATGGRAVSEPYYSQRAQFLRLSERFFHLSLSSICFILDIIHKQRTKLNYPVSRKILARLISSNLKKLGPIFIIFGTLCAPGSIAAKYVHNFLAVILHYQVTLTTQYVCWTLKNRIPLSEVFSNR